MRTAIKFLTTKGVWFLLLILPIVTYAFTFWNVRTTQPTFKQHMESEFGFTGATGITDDLYSNTAFKDFLDSVNISEETFKTAGYVMSYMVLVEFIHLITDLMLCLPRIVQRFINKVVPEE